MGVLFWRRRWRCYVVNNWIKDYLIGGYSLYCYCLVLVCWVGRVMGIYKYFFLEMVCMCKFDVGFEGEGRENEKGFEESRIKVFLGKVLIIFLLFIYLVFYLFDMNF